MKISYTQIDEKVVKVTAEIVGPSSAAAQALRDAAERRSRGEVVSFFKSGSTIIVRGQPGSAPAPELQDHSD